MITVEYVIAKGKTELGRRTVTVDGDAVVASVDGPAPDGTESDVTFTLTPPLADAIANGELPLSVGFMRGTVKMAGDSGALLQVLPVLDRTSGF